MGKVPEEQIKNNNPWYTVDQFVEQWQNNVSREIILNRWHVWGNIISSWWGEACNKELGVSLRVLDTGCGDGINLAGLGSILSRMSIDYSLFGADYNPLRVSRARQRFENVNIMKADARRMPFKDHSFQIVLCNAVLEHIHEDMDVLKELRRILHPDGIIIIGVPNEGCLMARIRNFVLQPKIAKTTDHVQFYTAEKLISTVSAAGLEPTVLTKEDFFFPHLAVSNLIHRLSVGRWLLKLLRTLFPSQAAELICACRKLESSSEMLL